MRKMFVAVVLSVAVLPMLGVSSASAATPYPSNCTKQLYENGRYAQARCTSGGGTFQVYATCNRREWWGTASWFTEGYWVRAGGTSTVSCGNGGWVASYGIGLRR